MDLISSLSDALGVDSSGAAAVAGTLLGPVRDGIAGQFGGDAVAQLDDAMPELGGWAEQAKAAVDEGSGGLGGLLGGGAGGLLGAAAGAIGGKGAQDAAAVASLLGKLGIDESKAVLAAPLVLSFLKDRLDSDLLDKALAVAPMLSGDGPGSALGGLLGGFGR